MSEAAHSAVLPVGGAGTVSTAWWGMVCLIATEAILFVYLIIAVSEYVLRRRTPDAKLQVKMWGFPVLTLLTIAAIVGVLVSMGVGEDTRSQLVLSLVSLAVVVLVYLAVARRNRNVPAEPSAAERVEAAAPHRVLIVANETVGADDLLAEIRGLATDRDAEFLVCVPVNPVDTGQAEHKGAVYLWEATRRAAQERLDATLAILRGEGLRAEGELGDYRPMVAIDQAVARFGPDRIVISTHPVDRSAWLRDDLVARAERKYDVPVDHVVAHAPAPVTEA